MNEKVFGNLIALSVSLALIAIVCIVTMWGCDRAKPVDFLGDIYEYDESAGAWICTSCTPPSAVEPEPPIIIPIIPSVEPIETAQEREPIPPPVSYHVHESVTHEHDGLIMHTHGEYRHRDGSPHYESHDNIALVGDSSNLQPEPEPVVPKDDPPPVVPKNSESTEPEEMPPPTCPECGQEMVKLQLASEVTEREPPVAASVSNIVWRIKIRSEKIFDLLSLTDPSTVSNSTLYSLSDFIMVVNANNANINYSITSVARHERSTPAYQTSFWVVTGEDISVLTVPDNGVILDTDWSFVSKTKFRHTGGGNYYSIE